MRRAERLPPRGFDFLPPPAPVFTMSHSTDRHESVRVPSGTDLAPIPRTALPLGASVGGFYKTAVARTIIPVIFGQCLLPLKRRLRPTTPLRRKRLLGGSRNHTRCPRNRPRTTRCPSRSPNRKSVRPSRSATPGLPYGD